MLCGSYKHIGAARVAMDSSHLDDPVLSGMLRDLRRTSNSVFDAPDAAAAQDLAMRIQATMEGRLHGLGGATAGGQGQQAADPPSLRTLDQQLLRAAASTRHWALGFVSMLAEGPLRAESVAGVQVPGVGDLGLPASMVSQSGSHGLGGSSATLASSDAAVARMDAAVATARTVNAKGLRSHAAIGVCSSSPHFVLKYAQYLSKRLGAQAADASGDQLPSAHLPERVALFDRAGVALMRKLASTKVSRC